MTTDQLHFRLQPATARPRREPAAPAMTTASPAPDERPIIGYFPHWGPAQGYLVKNMVTSGAAARLTHINYAFANIVDQRCVLGDPALDYQRVYSAAESVDGVADSGPLCGNFGQLKKLKALYPQLKILASLGGWTWSAGFSDAALPEHRVAFVKSCVDLFLKGNFGPGVVDDGIFDGIDVDWEYPGSPGASNSCRPEDTRNFTALLAELRRQLDELSARTGRRYLLTIAAPAGPDKFRKLELDRIHQHLDWLNVMTYDIHGHWEQRTNFNSPLYPSAADPDRPLNIDTQSVIEAYLRAGVPASKLVMGVPFYGRGWRGVARANNGLYQSASGPAEGRFETGLEGYKFLKEREAAGSFIKCRDVVTSQVWLYNPHDGVFWSYDDPETLAQKVAFVRERALRGVMFWDVSHDDPNGSLIAALYEGLTRAQGTGHRAQERD